MGAYMRATCPYTRDETGVSPTLDGHHRIHKDFRPIRTFLSAVRSTLANWRTGDAAAYRSDLSTNFPSYGTTLRGTQVSSSQPDTRGTVCHVHLHGMLLEDIFVWIRSHLHFPSAEVIAQMIVAELTGTVWTQPDWLPTRYLTWTERG